MHSSSPETPTAGAASLAVVIPVFNSESSLGPLVDRVVEVLSPHFARLEIILVNDGSRDGSHATALAARERHPEVVRYIRLARNFGEHNAVMCGLRYVTADCAAIIDDDFQNPPEEILRLTQRLAEGYDVVYGRYIEKHHHWFRNFGSWFNDRVATLLLKKPSGLYLSSFKVLNAFLIRTILAYDGPYPYLDGLILRATDAIAQEPVRHAPRGTARSNYTLPRLVRLWLNMFTNFSIVPLRMASVVGFLTAAAGFGLAIFFTISRFTGGILAKSDIPPGWASTIVVLTIFAGAQLAVLGMLGEYLGRAFLTQNRTPQYVVRETYGAEAPTGERSHPNGL